MVATEVVMSGLVAMTKGEGSSPEDEAGKLLNRSRGHLSVDALMVEKGDVANAPSIAQSFAPSEGECPIFIQIGTLIAFAFHHG